MQSKTYDCNNCGDITVESYVASDGHTEILVDGAIKEKFHGRCPYCNEILKFKRD
jgi:predicted RNA-binding Zn-ribbon protein involved in translation (DUF1610 family)